MALPWVFYGIFMTMTWKQKYIGDRAFYTRVLSLAVPMILQNLVTTFVSLLDNIMVGQVGTMQMSGVSICNQFVFIFNITIFGAISGPGIFGAQFFGKKDYEGQKQSVRFRLLIVLILAILFAFVFCFWQDPLISLYLSREDAAEAIAATLQYGKEYMSVIVLSFFPFALGQAYASVVKECGETQIPMYGSLAAVGVNLLLDYGLIFGKLGFPKLGVAGAAWATVIAKCVEAAVIICWAHSHPLRNPYINGLFHTFQIPAALLKDMIRRSIPLLINEFLWVLAMSIIAQCFSVRGLEVVAARNIASTVTNLCSAVYIQMGSCIAIIVGAALGARKHEEALNLDNKLIAFSVFAAILAALVIVPVAFFFPMLYNTEIEIRKMATDIILLSAVCMPIWSYTNACYFTLRSGGRTGVTFLFDFVFTWVLQIPLALLLAYRTNMHFLLLYAIVNYAEIVKAVIGYFMVRSRMWIQTIVG